MRTGSPVWLLSLLLLSSLPLTAPAEDTEGTVDLTSAEWEGYTEADGQGLYFDVLNAVFQPTDLTYTLHLLPWRRAQFMVENQQADGLVGTYHDNDKPLIYPFWHIDMDAPVVAAFSLWNDKIWQGPESLETARVGWIRGYGFEKWLPDNVNPVTVGDLETGVQLLKMGRIDYLLDYERYLAPLLHKPFVMKQAIAPKKLYVGFQKTPRGQRLADLFDQRMAALYRSGKLKQLYRDQSADELRAFAHTYQAYQKRQQANLGRLSQPAIEK
ncbi:transporter substrate-binding domain-containing protein [Marinobacteraceae bacterium S3BR75-40.1]